MFFFNFSKNLLCGKIQQLYTAFTVIIEELFVFKEWSIMPGEGQSSCIGWLKNQLLPLLPNLPSTWFSFCWFLISDLKWTTTLKSKSKLKTYYTRSLAPADFTGVVITDYHSCTVWKKSLYIVLVRILCPIPLTLFLVYFGHYWLYSCKFSSCKFFSD